MKVNMTHCDINKTKTYKLYKILVQKLMEIKEINSNVLTKNMVKAGLELLFVHFCNHLANSSWTTCTQNNIINMYGEH